jgi:hypothetical protein
LRRLVLRRLSQGGATLRLLARLDRIGADGVERSLRAAGLADRADDPVATYSLGMRQRLGIAAALLRDPEVVVLDEPANGLDPAGIAEIRGLLIALAGEGRTVIVSSHLLDEAEKMCDRVAVMDAGRCVAVGPIRDLLASAGAGGLVVGVADLETARLILAAAGLNVTIVDGRLRVSCPASDAARVTELLASAGLFVNELRYDTPTLEDFFFGLTAPVGAGATAVTDLFAADLKRILWRPMTQAIGGFGVVLAAAVGVIVFLRTAHQPFATRTAPGWHHGVCGPPLGFRLLHPRRLGPWCRLHESGTDDSAHLGATSSPRAGVTTMCLRAGHRGLDRHHSAGAHPGTAPAAIVHGTGGVLDGAWYLSMAAMTLRCVLFTAAMSIIGVSAAAIGRSTTAAVIGIVWVFRPDRVHGFPGRAIVRPVVALHRCHLVDRPPHNRRRPGRAHGRYRRAAPGRWHGGPLGAGNDDFRAQGRYVKHCVGVV